MCKSHSRDPRFPRQPQRCENWKRWNDRCEDEVINCGGRRIHKMSPNVHNEGRAQLVRASSSIVGLDGVSSSFIGSVRVRPIAIAQDHDLAGRAIRLLQESCSYDRNCMGRTSEPCSQAHSFHPWHEELRDRTVPTLPEMRRAALRFGYPRAKLGDSAWRSVRGLHDELRESHRTDSDSRLAHECLVSQRPLASSPFRDPL